MQSLKYKPNPNYSTPDLKERTDPLTFSSVMIYLGGNVDNISRENHIRQALLIQFTNPSYKPKLINYFHMYRFQLNFDLLCTTSFLGTPLEHRKHYNMSVHSVYHLCISYHIRVILHHLVVPLPHEETLITSDLFYTKSYAVFVPDP